MKINRTQIKKCFLKFINVLKDKDRKPVLQILKELAVRTYVSRCLPTDYFTLLLFRKQADNYLDFLSRKEHFQVHRVSHTRDTLDILDNKLLFHEHFSKSGISLPVRLGYNLKKMWYSDTVSGTGSIELKSADVFATLLRGLFSGNDIISIFAKPLYGGGGHEILRITKDLLSPELPDRDRLFTQITGGCFIFQKQVIQHPELSRLNNSSLNTIRIDTFLGDNNNPELISAYLRMGIAGSFVDNLSSGGIFAGIDLPTGELCEIGRRKLERGSAVYKKHPDSGVEFKGFKIPCFEEVKALASLASSMLQEKLVGWDIGVTDKGPLLMEGNGWYEIRFSEIAYGGYRRNPVFKKVMEASGLPIR